MRIVIAGAGIAGLSAAWLLDPVHQVVVLEPQPRPGGHVHSVTARVGDRDVAVDMGAQHISPEAFPTLNRLLEAAGLAPGRLVPVPLSTTVLHPPQADPLLVTPHSKEPGWSRTPMLGPAWEAVGALVTEAVAWESRNVSWERSLAELVEPLPIPRSYKDSLIYPLLASFVGCDVTGVREMSARAAMAFLLRVPPASPDEAPLWHNLEGGLGGLAEALAAGVTNGEVHTGAGVAEIRRQDGRFELTDTRGRRHPADQVVLATPPEVTARLLAPLPGTAELRTALNAFDHVNVTVAVHTDPAYMPADRRHWSTNTVTAHDGWGETSTWYGPINGVEVFKSWITHRERPPQRIVAQESFRQLRLTPDAVRARPVLERAQGTGGLHLAGHYLDDIDSQESAVHSAVAIARRLAPDSPRSRQVLP